MKIKRIEIDQSNLDTIYMSNFLDAIVIFWRTFPMDTRNKKKLFKNFVRLVTETPVDPVVRHLKEKRILNDKQAEDILYQNMAKNKVRQLLMILVRRGPRAFSLSSKPFAWKSSRIWMIV
jgi:hypothetical protein